MKTLAFTGIRISELKFFTVESLRKEKIVIYNKGKVREVYLPKKLSDALWEYCADQEIESGVIFRGNKDRPITRIYTSTTTEEKRERMNALDM